MQNSYSETIKQLKNGKLLTEKFNFDCQLCGLCCSELQNVWLEPYDVFRLSRFAFKTQIPTFELFKQGFLEISIDKTKNLPFCKIRFN
ncbi:hypothetical protein IT568_02020, partial [bacterium]|nr:hypothetical protein [bacterium]